MSRNLKIFLNWFLLFFWMGAIFFLSSRQDLKSGLESWLDFALRKIAHMAEYAALIFLAWRAFSRGGEEKSLKYILGAMTFSFLYAISDEYHQILVAGRVGSPIDVLIDGAGIIIAGMGIWRKRIRNNFK